MVLNKVCRGEITGGAAAELLGRSQRQLRRLLTRCRKKGAKGLIHGNRGRRPVNAVKTTVGKQIVKLARTTYRGVNQQHFSELLAEREKITLSRSSVRRLLEKAGIASPRQQRRRAHRSRRERYSQEGMLVQIDASDHAWFSGKKEKAALFAARIRQYRALCQSQASDSGRPPSCQLCQGPAAPSLLSLEPCLLNLSPSALSQSRTAAFINLQHLDANNVSFPAFPPVVTIY